MVSEISNTDTDQEYLWDKKHRKGEHTRNNRNPFAEKAGEYFSTSGKVLDIGCGVGKDASFFAHAGYEVLATDISSEVIAQNEVYFHQENLNFAKLDASQYPLPFENETFDVVYSHLALHYYPDATTHALFAELHRILKDGGVLAFACKSIDDPHYGVGEELEKDMFVTEGHVRHFFSVEYVKELLQDKFDIEFLQDRQEKYGDTSSAFVWCVAKKRME
jgi:SAM-dependent methyltransferase